jgi:hypothetical protein
MIVVKADWSLAPDAGDAQKGARSRSERTGFELSEE